MLLLSVQLKICPNHNFVGEFSEVLDDVGDVGEHPPLHRQAGSVLLPGLRHLVRDTVKDFQVGLHLLLVVAHHLPSRHLYGGILDKDSKAIT